MPFYCGKTSASICVVLGAKKFSTYSSEYASDFFQACGLASVGISFPRNEGYSERAWIAGNGKGEARSWVPGIVMLKSVVLIDADMPFSFIRTVEGVQAAQSDLGALFKVSRPHGLARERAAAALF
jgi:hypothetical protein